MTPPDIEFTLSERYKVFECPNGHTFLFFHVTGSVAEDEDNRRIWAPPRYVNYCPECGIEMGEDE